MLYNVLQYKQFGHLSIEIPNNSVKYAGYACRELAAYVKSDLPGGGFHAAAGSLSDCGAERPRARYGRKTGSGGMLAGLPIGVFYLDQLRPRVLKSKKSTAPSPPLGTTSADSSPVCSHWPAIISRSTRPISPSWS